MEDEIKKTREREKRDRLRVRKKAASNAWRILRPPVVFVLSLAL